MKNSTIQLLCFLLLFASTSGIAFGQKVARNPFFSSSKNVKFKATGEKLFSVDLMTNPLMAAKSKASLTVQFQSEAISPHFSLVGSGSYFARTATLPKFDYQMDDRTFGAEVRYYPFQVQNIGRKKYQFPIFCNNRYSCVEKRKGFATNLLRGLYVAPGYQFQKTHLNYVTTSNEEAPIEKFSFEITSHKATLHAGYLLRFYRLTLGASYGLMMGQPKWKGPIDIFNDQHLSGAFPFKYRLEHGLRLEAGINF